jgi:hypothetical protein
MSSQRHPYKPGADRYFVARSSFAVFGAEARERAHKLIDASPRGRAAASIHALNILADDVTVQIWLGKRPVPERQAPRGGHVVEQGATLLYSLGATGGVLVALYPASSDVHRSQEARLDLEIGRMSLRHLRKAMPAHISDLVAYHYCTALDGEPSASERLRVWWLRLTRTMEVDGTPTRRLGIVSGWIGQRLVQAAIGAVLRPLGLAAVLLLLLWLGWGRGAHFVESMLRH